MASWGPMHQQQVGICWDGGPLLPKFLTPWQIEGPVAEFGLPGGTVDLVATDFNLSSALKRTLKMTKRYKGIVCLSPSTC